LPAEKKIALLDLFITITLDSAPPIPGEPELPDTILWNPGIEAHVLSGNTFRIRQTANVSHPYAKMLKC